MIAAFMLGLLGCEGPSLPGADAGKAPAPVRPAEASSARQDAEWMTYSPAGGRFSVLLPQRAADIAKFFGSFKVLGESGGR